MGIYYSKINFFINTTVVLLLLFSKSNVVFQVMLYLMVGLMLIISMSPILVDVMNRASFLAYQQNKHRYNWQTITVDIAIDIAILIVAYMCNQYAAIVGLAICYILNWYSFTRWVKMAKQL